MWNDTDSERTKMVSSRFRRTLLFVVQLSLQLQTTIAAKGVVKFGECSIKNKPVQWNYHCYLAPNVAVESGSSVAEHLRVSTGELAAAVKDRQMTMRTSDCVFPQYYNTERGLYMQYYSWVDVNGLSFDGWIGCDKRKGTPCGVYACAVRPDVRPELYNCICDPAAQQT